MQKRESTEVRLARAAAARHFVAAYLARQSRLGRAIRARDLAWQRERERRELSDQQESLLRSIDRLSDALRPQA